MTSQAIREREHTDARRSLGDAVRLLVEGRARGSAAWLAQQRGEGLTDAAALALADASGVAPPGGALNWHGHLSEFPRSVDDSDRLGGA